MNAIKFLTTTVFFLFSITSAFSQYTTPNTGVIWTLDDIAAASPATITVSGSTYTLHEDLIVDTEDSLTIHSNITLQIGEGIEITIFGSFGVDADEVLITAVDQTAPYKGFRFEQLSTVNIQNATIEYGGGLQVLTETFTLNNCTIQYHNSGSSTSAAVSMSRGIPVITNNTFRYNLTSALGSAVNTPVSAYIFNNHIEGNNQTNANRPQINIGVTMATDTLKIISNTIIGDRDMNMTGGIAVMNFLGGAGRVLAIIEGNTIKDNRYGITIGGSNSYAFIKNNVIEDNDTQGDPIAGGSGINFNSLGDGQAVVADNQIRRNLWGITIQGAADVNLGDDKGNGGGNLFADNGNNDEVFALYNNGPSEVLAKHNCWIEGQKITLEDAEEVIFHKIDDKTLGEVIFDPVCVFAATEDFIASHFQFYPNPAKNGISFQNTLEFLSVSIYNIQGKKVLSRSLKIGENQIFFELPSGMYFVKFEGENHQEVKKMIVE